MSYFSVPFFLYYTNDFYYYLFNFVLFVFVFSFLSYAYSLKKNFEIAKIIYDKGCVQAGEEWMERNLILISTSAIIAIFFQV